MGAGEDSRSCTDMPPCTTKAQPLRLTSGQSPLQPISKYSLLRTSRSLFCFNSCSMPLINWDAACVCVCVRKTRCQLWLSKQPEPALTLRGRCMPTAVDLFLSPIGVNQPCPKQDPSPTGSKPQT